MSAPRPEVVAVLIGVTLLNETVPLAPVRAVIGIAGLVATIAGSWALTRRPSRAEHVSHGQGGSVWPTPRYRSPHE